MTGAHTDRGETGGRVGPFLDVRSAGRTLPGAARDPDPLIEAAGVLCWRPGGDGTPEVLLVHRPGYDDWSWPKGKVRPGETPPACAVREALEETGVTVVLGAPLPGTSYRLPDGRTKQVRYWAARPHRGAVGPAGPADPNEVDQLAWLPLSDARARLTRSGDREPLDALASLAGVGQLDTVPVMVLRHATARPRDAWPRAEADRPLVASGRRQALGLVPLLTCWRPQQVVSSPWRRCLDTVGPYVSHSGARVRTRRGLSERGHRRSRAKARRQIDALVRRQRPLVLCTHRPVLADVFDALTGYADRGVRAGFPQGDPWLAPGEVFVAHITHAGGPSRVVSVERHLTPR